MGRALGIGLALVIIFAGAYFFIPSFQSWVKSFFDPWITNASGLSAGITVTFTDGTTQSIGPTSGTLVPLTLSMGNPAKPIASITINLYLTATYTGNMTSAQTVGNATLRRGKLVGGGSSILTVYQINSGLTPVSGVASKIWTQTLTASYLQNGLEGGDYLVFFKFDIIVLFTVSFTGGITQSKAGTGLLQVNMYYAPDGNISSLSVTADFSVLYA